MENQSPKREKKVFLVSGLVFLVLFVLPLGSIYFLNSGVSYRKASLSELEDKGKVGAFQLYNQVNIPVSPETLHGKVAVVNFLSEDDSTAHYQMERLSKVHQSYNETEDVVFLSFIKADSTTNMIDRAKGLGINDHQQWFLLGTDEENFRSLSASGFQITEPDKGIALVDTSMTIRRHYDISSNPEMGRLVEQIAIVIPKQKRRGL